MASAKKKSYYFSRDPGPVRYFSGTLSYAILLIPLLMRGMLRIAVRLRLRAVVASADTATPDTRPKVQSDSAGQNPATGFWQ